MKLPTAHLLRQFDTHRLIPSKYSAGGGSVLTRIADDDGHLKAIFDLDHATNERLLAENNLPAGIGIHELVFEVPYYRIVNAAYCHPHPLGSRFNAPERGAWYAAFQLPTAQAEVAFHKSIELEEVGWWDETVTYDGYLADFSADFHDIRGDPQFAKCLSPDTYEHSQKLAEDLLANAALGVIYPSVRDANGICVVCFRPTLVMNVRKSGTFEFSWQGKGEPSITQLQKLI